MKKKILILCTGNSCRSQMAEGFFKKHLGEKAEVVSAGTEAHGLNPRAVAAMREIGIDISKNESKTFDRFLKEHFDFVITVCDDAKENCPFFPNALHRIHKNFPDPAKATGTDEERRNSFSEVRNEIKKFSIEFASLHF